MAHYQNGARCNRGSFPRYGANGWLRWKDLVVVLAFILPNFLISLLLKTRHKGRQPYFNFKLARSSAKIR